MEKASSANDGSPESLSNSDLNNNNVNVVGLKKPVWKKPGNGVVESGSIMGDAISWPALSESIKPILKSSSDGSKTNSDGSISQALLISETLQHKTNSNENTNSTTNHGLPRQRSTRHRGSSGGGGGGSNNGPQQVGYNRLPPPPPPPLPPSFPVMGPRPFGTFVAPILETPVRGATILETPVRGARPMGGLGHQSGGNQSSQPQRSSFRRNGFGSRLRGVGQNNHNNGGRRDSDRVPHQFFPSGPYIPPPPPGAAPFIPPTNMRPFMTPMGYDMTTPFMIVPTLGPEPFRGMSLIPQPPALPMYFPTVDMHSADMHLPNMIVRQIDYYFSDTNLVSDDYLKSNMDEEGWVSIDLIANFPRVQRMTTDIQLILESLRTSTVVEVQGNKIRRRGWNIRADISTWASAGSGSQPRAVVPSDESVPDSFRVMSLNAENNGNTRGSEDTLVSQ